MNKIKWHYKLLLIALFISILPAALISVNMINKTQDEVTTFINWELINTAEHLSEDINNFFVNNYGEISLVVTAVENENLGANEKVSIIEAGVKNIEEIMTSSLLFYENNKYVNALRVVKQGLDSLNIDFDNIVTQYSTGFKTMADEKKYIGNIVFDTNFKKWTVITLLPVRIANAPPAFLFSMLDLSGLKTKLEKYKLRSNGRIYLVDKFGNYIFSKPQIESDNSLINDAMEMLTKTSRSSGVSSLERNNKSIIASFAFPKKVDLAVISEMDSDSAYTVLSEMNNIFFIWIVVGVFAAGLGVMVFTRMIGKPIHVLADKAHSIANGQFDIEVNYSTRDSIGLLGESILSMSKSLKDSFRKIEEQNRQLEEYNRTLEDKVKERTEQLKKTNDDLQAAYLKVLDLNNEKNEFLGIAAHDLKNPLAVIKGYGAIIVEDEDLARDELVDFAQIIVSSSERMFDIITSLLDINKIEEGKIDIKYNEVNVNRIVDEIIMQNSGNAAKKNIKLNYNAFSDEVIITSDKNIISQVADNLLSNAIKFSPSNKEIFIDLRKSGDNILISIRDQGPGLTNEDKKKLFKKFSKLSARPTGGEHSTGLGLSIVKKLLELLGADIRVESEFGNGAEFIVEIPA